MLGAYGADSYQCQSVPVALGLREGHLVGGDGERVHIRPVDTPLDLDEQCPARSVRGTNVETLVVMRHLLGGASQCPFRLQRQFDGPAVDFRSIASEQA